MKLQTFLDRMSALCVQEGVPSIRSDDVVGMTDLAQTQLNAYCKATQCLYSQNVTFFPIVGAAVYSVYDNATRDATILNPDGSQTRVAARPMCDVKQVVINGAALRKFGTNMPGLSSEMELLDRGYCSGQPTGANPIWAYWKTPNTLVFTTNWITLPTSSWLSGACYHTPLTLNNGGLEQVLDLAPEDELLAAEFAAVELLRPGNREKAFAWSQELSGRMEMRRVTCIRESTGPARRLQQSRSGVYMGEGF